MSKNKLKVNFNQFEKTFGQSLKVNIQGVSSLSKPEDNTAIFALNPNDFHIVKNNKNILLFSTALPNEMVSNNNIQIIISLNPRLSYITFVRECTNWDFNRTKNINLKHYIFIDESAYVDPSAMISPFCYIGPNCFVGPYCLLEPGVKLIENVELKSNVIIGANSVIGHQGFSIERKNNRPREAAPIEGTAVSMPHVGGVIIGDDCVIGSNCTIASGTIDPTKISDNFRCDDQVHIAHNCEFADCCAVTAQVTFGGSVIVERNSWVGLNTTVKQKIRIHEKSLIGVGSNVINDVKANSIQAGNPAKVIKRSK